MWKKYSYEKDKKIFFVKKKFVQIEEKRQKALMLHFHKGLEILLKISQQLSQAQKRINALFPNI